MMEFRNLTPFDSICYRMIDVADKEFHVIAMKVGYNVSNGECFVEDKNPKLLRDQDQFYGEINQSAIRYESDFAPYKPLCDVIVNASAYAPEGEAAESVLTQLILIDEKQETLLDKTLLVKGESQFYHAGPGWTQSKAEPFTSLAIDYRYAYGGENKLYETDETKAYIKRLKDKEKLSETDKAGHPEQDKAPIAHTADENNVIGRGFADSWYLNALKNPDILAPSVMYPDAIFDISAFLNQLKSREDKAYLPAGFGFVSRAAKNRLHLAGTYDDSWLETRHPNLPEDFDFAYWNGAPIDQQIPYPNANLSIHLHNMTPLGEWRATLPGHRAFVLLRFHSGEVLPVMLRLDTVIIEPEAEQIELTYRLSLSTELNIRVIEARFEIDPNAPLVRFAAPQKEEGKDGQ